MSVTPPNDLEKFLLEPSHCHAKESILMNKLIFDFKLAASIRGYHLESYTSDVDHEGFDIIFDDQDQIKKLQVKTVMGNDLHRHGVSTSVSSVPNYTLLISWGSSFHPQVKVFKGV